MALLPGSPVSLLALLLIAGGVALLFRRGVPKAYGMGALIFLVAALDLVAALVGQPPTGAHLGLRLTDVAERGVWWTPITSMFVHAGFLHLFGNLFILVTVGPALEERVGEGKFLLIYYLAGLGAVAAHALLAFTTDIVSPASLALGASGAIFGVLTAFAVRYPREKIPVVLPGLFFVLWLPAFLVLLLFLGFNLVYMFAQTGIAWWGHFAGFLVGLPFAYAMPSPKKAGAKGLPDAEKLAPFATTRETERILERIRQFTPETRTKDDSTYVEAWLDKFFAKATCAQGHAFARDGFVAKCEGGETLLEFGRR